MAADSSSLSLIILLYLTFDTIIIYWLSTTGTTHTLLNWFPSCLSGAHLPSRLRPLSWTPSSLLSASSPWVTFPPSSVPANTGPPPRLPPAAAALMNYNGSSRLAALYLSNLLHIATSPHTPTSPSPIHPTLLPSGALELIATSDQDYWLSLSVQIQTKSSSVEAATPFSALSLRVLKKGAYNWNEGYYYSFMILVFIFLLWTFVPVSRGRGVSTVRAPVTKTSVNLTSFSENSRGYTKINLTEGFLFSERLPLLVIYLRNLFPKTFIHFHTALGSVILIRTEMHTSLCFIIIDFWCIPY